MKRLLILALILGFIGPQLQAQSDKKAQDIITRVISNAKTNDDQKEKHLIFKKVKITRDFKTDDEDERKELWQGVGYIEEPLEFDPGEVLSTSYDFTLYGSGTNTDGINFHQIRFRPRPNISDGSNYYQKAAKRMSGTLWIDSDHLYVYRLSAEMPRDKSFSAWFFGSVDWVELSLTQSRRTDLKNIIVINQVSAKVTYYVLGWPFNKEYIRRYQDYRYVN